MDRPSVPGALHATRGRRIAAWFRDLWKRIYLWLLVVGLVAVLPPLVTWISSYTHSNAPSTAALLAEGDGFLIAIAIAADAIGRVAEHERKLTASSFLCALVLFAALTAFVTTKADILNQKSVIEQCLRDNDSKKLFDTLRSPPNDEEHIVIESKIVLCASFVTSFIIIVRQKDGTEEEGEHGGHG